MSRIRGKNTVPELVVRRMLHKGGYRFLTHVSSLPGTPDVAFTRRKKVVFVHGCFWHRHPGCPRAATPSSRVEFWEEKFDRNRVRDRRVQDELHNLGWTVLVIWECETKQPDDLRTRLTSFLGAPKHQQESISC